jgi:hypothetical protein
MKEPRGGPCLKRIAKLEPDPLPKLLFNPYFILITLSTLSRDIVKTSFASPSDAMLVVGFFRSCRRDVHPIDDSRDMPFRSAYCLVQIAEFTQRSTSLLIQSVGIPAPVVCSNIAVEVNAGRASLLKQVQGPKV